MADQIELCTWSDLPTDQCSHCRDGGKAPIEPEDVLRWFEARFASNLACGHFANSGTIIGVTADGEYVCRKCGH